MKREIEIWKTFKYGTLEGRPVIIVDSALARGFWLIGDKWVRMNAGDVTQVGLRSRASFEKRFPNLPPFPPDLGPEKFDDRLPSEEQVRRSYSPGHWEARMARARELRKEIERRRALLAGLTKGVHH